MGLFPTCSSSQRFPTLFCAAVCGEALSVLPLSVGSFFGVHAFSLTLIGLFFGRFSDRVFKEQFFLPITASVAATFAKYVITAALVYLLGYHFNLFLHMGRVLFILLLFQLIFAYPIHWATFHLDKRVRDPER